MRRRSWSVLSGVAVAAVAMATVQAPAQAIPAQADPEPQSSTHQQDNLSSPMGEQQQTLREEAVTKLVKGEATLETRNGHRVIRVPKGKYGKEDKFVQYDVNREESVFTVLTDFGTQTDPRFSSAPGPVHNTIPSPDRVWDGNSTDDNSTYWTKDFNRQHYLDMMFGATDSFKDFYTKQSNGRFLAKGDVSDWVTVPYNEARYGARNNADGYWNYIKDTATAWYADQVRQGKTPEQIKAYLSQFDKVDRYDYDHDGNFNEPDGYIDHFQAIHAGEGEEAGGGAQGTDAIWSHRWYAYSTNAGKTGPSGNLLGGVPLGDSGIWIGDYTTEPENGGLGVFAHEFGHDLGLPDLYDTNGGDNGTGFWTIMSAGSWLNDGTDSIGTKPGYEAAWEKLQLGWLDYRKVTYGEDATVKLGPADRDSKTTPQAILVNLPDKDVHTDYNTPHSGSTEWWGGSADNLNTSMTRTIDLTAASSASLTAAAWYDVEQGYDYLYGEVSTDGGATWADAAAPVTGTNTSWTTLTYDLSKWAGQKVLFRFRYATDGGVHLKGPFLDDITVTANGAPVLTDDVENGDNGWTADGFTRMNGSTDVTVPQFYLAENRNYAGYDATLRTGPYNFGDAVAHPDWVERFPYQNGLLVSYVDGEFTDNNTSVHPGHGQVLQVDARPSPVRFADGRLLGNRRQPFDATFGQEATDAVTFHRLGVPTTVASQPAIPTFDDSDPMRYWSAQNPWNSVQVAGTGTRMSVVDTSTNGDDMTVRVAFAK
ncbi:immune inhibitor A domain-containing protein [Oryzihumus sp.]|uniref:immune inhibitor A domain-containing protein n=1 Tax=Oryzihumus sp. TaxID=1968903 RepID=UPI002EDA8348